MKTKPYCEAQAMGLECGKPVSKWGEQCDYHSGKTTIKIYKHTPKRYRQSKWELSEPWWGCPEPLNTLYLVTDLQRVPKGSIKDEFQQTINIAMRQKVADDISPKARQNLYDYATAMQTTKKLGFWRNLWQNKIRRK